MRYAIFALGVGVVILASCAQKKEFQKVDYGEYEKCMNSIALYDRCANPGTSCEFHAKKVSVALEDSDLKPAQRDFIVRTCYRICLNREVYLQKVKPKLIRECSQLLNPK
ncbi:MAG: hypothetical protein GXO18_00020 [Aquificae bacterium]|nr:hypothetical protein [Aquificota bacterium]